jgi:hypothetical protein
MKTCIHEYFVVVYEEGICPICHDKYKEVLEDQIIDLKNEKEILENQIVDLEKANMLLNTALDKFGNKGDK